MVRSGFGVSTFLSSVWSWGCGFRGKDSVETEQGIAVPRNALGGGIQKPFDKRCCQLFAINAHKMAPRSSQGLQERAWDAPTKGLEWGGVFGGCGFGLRNRGLVFQGQGFGVLEWGFGA